MEASPRRILVIDDNAHAADSLALILGHWGHEVQAVYDGKDGVSAALAFRPEIVFLDIEMPAMDGFEVARAIRQLAELEGAILVALSGHELSGETPERDRALFDYRMSKPLSFAALGRVLLKGVSEGRRSAATGPV
jgi:CheY-like chemotaxis protein